MRSCSACPDGCGKQHFKETCLPAYGFVWRGIDAQEKKDGVCYFFGSGVRLTTKYHHH